MDMASKAEELVDAVRGTFVNQAKDERPIHKFGISAHGQFKASHVAKDYCDAPHFRGKLGSNEFKNGFVPVTVRFSNAAGGKKQPDHWSDVRGMAVRFHLNPDVESAQGENEIATDLIAMTLGEFFSPTVDEFLAFAKNSRPSLVKRQSICSKIVDMLQLKRPMPDPYPGQEHSGAPGALDYANRHRSAQLAVLNAATIGAPVSYARANYYAVHTFLITGPPPEQRQRYVRFQWQPIAGVRAVDRAIDSLADFYLQAELRKRLQYWPVQFRLLMTIGEIGDPLTDPTVRWPEKRVRVVMGTLTLNSIAEDQEFHSEKISFNPCRLVKGIELSGDPILEARKEAYEVSRKRRGGRACPFNDG